MTTWFTRVAMGALALATLGLNSCKKDESQVVLKTAAAPTLTASTTTPDLVLTTTNSGATADVFTYTAADFGFASVNTYSLQLDKKGGNFSNAQTIASSGTAGTFTLTKGQLVTAFLNLGFQPGVPAQADVRLVASVSTTAPTQASPVITLSATPTPVCIPNTTNLNWSVIGPAGVDWNTDKALTYDCYTQTFKATMPFNVGEFKLRANNKWDVNLGTSSSTSAITMSVLAKGVSLVGGNNNLQITTAGTYTITLVPTVDASNVVTGGTVTVK